MKTQLIVELKDIRHLGVKCPACKTKLVFDLQNLPTKRVNYSFPAEFQCSGCPNKLPGGLIQELIDLYGKLSSHGEMISFLSEPEEALRPVTPPQS